MTEMSAKSDAERRKHIRLPFKGQLFAWACATERGGDGPSRPEPVKAEDFSWGGFRLSTSRAVPAGGCLEVHIPSVSGQKPVAIQGRVAWVEEKKGRYFLGLDCDRIPVSAVDLIMRHKTEGLAGA